MSKTLYNAAMDRITMSEQCENSILEAAMSKTPTVHRKRGKIRFIPVLAAAAILVTGTATAAAANGLDWVKSFFKDDSFEVTDDIAAMTTEMDNFNCISEDENINISPIGTIADDTAIYCLLHVDSTSDDFDYRYLKLADVRVNDIDFNKPAGNLKDIYGNEKEGWTLGYGMEYNDDNTLAVKITTNYKSFKDADKINMEFAKIPLKDESDIAADTIIAADNEIESYTNVSFELCMGDINYLEINYNACRTIAIDDFEVIAENMYVTPLRVMINAKKCEYVPISKMKDITITLKDGSTVIASRFGGGNNACMTNDGYSYNMEWPLESPIDPDNISAVYIDDVCLYDCNAQ